MAGVRGRTDSEDLVLPDPADDRTSDAGMVAGDSVTRRFGLALIAIVVLGVSVRLLFVFGWTWGVPLHGDPLFFQQTAARVANGNGYVDQFLGKGPLVPTAEHPPVLTFILAALDLVGIRSLMRTG